MCGVDCTPRLAVAGCADGVVYLWSRARAYLLLPSPAHRHVDGGYPGLTKKSLCVRSGGINVCAQRGPQVHAGGKAACHARPHPRHCPLAASHHRRKLALLPPAPIDTVWDGAPRRVAQLRSLIWPLTHSEHGCVVPAAGDGCVAGVRWANGHHTASMQDRAVGRGHGRVGEVRRMCGADVHAAVLVAWQPLTWPLSGHCVAVDTNKTTTAPTGHW